MHPFILALKRRFVQLVAKSVKHMKLKAIKVPKEFAIDEWTEDIVEECVDQLRHTEHLTGWDYEVSRREVYHAIVRIRLDVSTQWMHIEAKKKFGIDD